MSTYYVSANGSDRNPGTINRPFATLQHAIDSIDRGDTINIRGGTYYLDRGVWLGDKHSGTASSHTTIQAHPGETVVIDGWNNNSGSLISIEGDYIDIVGLRLVNSAGHAIGVWGGDNVQIKDNIVHEAQNGGIIAHGSLNGGVEDRVRRLLVEGNTVYRTNLANQSRNASSGWDSGINATRADNVTIRNNKVYDNYGEGISLTLASNGTVADNTLYDNYSVQLYLDNARDSVVERNFVHNYGNQDFFRRICSGGRCEWVPATGIQLANEARNTNAYNLNNNVIRNNIVVGAGTSFSYGSYETSRGIKNTLVANNTFYGARKETLHIDADDDNQNVTFVNNIFDQGSNPLRFYIPSRSGLNFQRNLLGVNADTTTARQSTAGSNGVYADPLFVNAGGDRAEDYRLRSGSRAVDAGMAVDLLTDDYFRSRRFSGAAIDIGAYEVNSPSQNSTDSSRNTRIKGTARDDVLRGRNSRDTLSGIGGDDRLIGNGGNDLLKGGKGNDTLVGGSGSDVLVGANSNISSVNSIDVLTGGNGADKFIIGKRNAVFYNDGRTANSGLRDYALITDFNTNEDVIQLNGSADSYRVRGSSPIASTSGKAIYYDENQNGFDRTDELVAIVQTSQRVNLSAAHFEFV